MLKSWLIQNFKPIVDSGELQLAPVTVLAGRNSSGKSSLIQSILMIAQTLSSRVLDRALLPNGPIVQLGTFEDILSEQTNLRTLVVGFELEIIAKEGQRASFDSIRNLSKRQAIARLRANIRSVKVTAQFRSASSDISSTSAIEASKVNVENVSLTMVSFPDELLSTLNNQTPFEISPEFGIDIKPLSPTELNKFLNGVLPEYLRLVPYTLEELNYLGAFTLKSKSSHTRICDPLLVAFSHFLPSRLIDKYVIEERLRLRLMSHVRMAFEYPNAIVDLKKTQESKDKNFVDNEPIMFILDTFVSDNVRDVIVDICRDNGISEVFSGQTLFDLILWYRSLELTPEGDVVAEQLKEIVARGILERLSQNSKGAEGLETITNDPYVEGLEHSVAQTPIFHQQNTLLRSNTSESTEDSRIFP
jgi:hypothetical protein